MPVKIYALPLKVSGFLLSLLHHIEIEFVSGHKGGTQTHDKSGNIYPRT